MSRTRRPAAPNRVTFGRPAEDPVDPTMLVREVRLDGARVGLLWCEQRASQGVYRSTRYTYAPDQGEGTGESYTRLEEAREGIDRHHLGLPDLGGAG